MPWAPQPGESVQTDFGTATVIRTAGNDALVSLESSGGMEVRIAVSKLQPTSPPVVSIPTLPALKNPLPLDGLPESGEGERQALEALRFGLVPISYLDRLTLNYELLRDWIDGVLSGVAARKPAISTIVGPYGSGKSHTMATVRAIAGSRGYATAHVEVDGTQISLSEPARLLHALWQTVLLAEERSSTPLLDLHRKALASGHYRLRDETFPLAAVGKNHVELEGLLGMKPEAASLFPMRIEKVLEGDTTISPTEVNRAIRAEFGWRFSTFTLRAIIPPRRVERPFAFARALLDYAELARLAGYAGLVVTIDEFEVEWVNLTPVAQQQVVNSLAGLAGQLASKLSAPLWVCIATVPEAARLNVATWLRDVCGGLAYEIAEMHPHERRELARRIHTLYCNAYNLDESFDDQEAAAVERYLDAHGANDSGRIRAFIKRYVATLDSAYGPGPA